MSRNLEIFTTPEVRSSPRFRAKDAIIRRVLAGTVLHAGSSAICMPCELGPEARMLARKGVKPQNIWAIECVPSAHAAIATGFNEKGLPLPHPRGIRTTQKPLEFHLAVDEIWRETDKAAFDFVYLDFLSQPTAQMGRGLVRMFKLRMLGMSATLVITTGHNRHPSGFLHATNNTFYEHGYSACAAYVEAALWTAKHPPYHRVRSYQYESSNDKNKKSTYETRVYKWKEEA